MESDFPSPGGVNGINLANYFPNRRSNNTVVYFHKRFLPDTKEEKVQDIKKDIKPNNVKCKKKKTSNNIKHDKSQKHNSETANQQTFKYENIEVVPFTNSALEQTIKFSKNLVPLVIPQPKESLESPVIYTVKTSRKHKKQDKKRECSIEKDVTYNKDHLKNFEDKNRKRRKENYSARESIDPSSQNTLDDIHININQSCSFSESTEVKFHKRESSNNKISNDNSQKFFISNSFEALANGSVSDGNKIKIHLMNETDKTQFRESIRNPIVNTIRDYLSQINGNDSLNNDLNTVKKVLLSNSQKLDDILAKLACIEKKIENNAKQTNKTQKTPRVQSAMASKLEELGQDIVEVKEHEISDEEDLTEEYNNMLRRRRNGGKSVVVEIKPKEKDDKKNESLACGEEVPGPLNETSSVSQLGIKPDRPSRLPARFCWTDVDRKK
ncbi:uncharacterized protein LOC135079843 [Ostrinia nubilalis]|uniref:uncharacterized protein LOC135079843 n=1 Tax=Ostrinia nubilalis TaxID=29057 RepID=UPI0030823E46